MEKSGNSKTIGSLLILSVILLSVPYTILITIFDYPDVLRYSTETILINSYHGGAPLIITWLAFALVGFPLIAACIGLGQRLEHYYPPLRWGTVTGVIGLVAQMIEL